MKVYFQGALFPSKNMESIDIEIGEGEMCSHQGAKKPWLDQFDPNLLPIVQDIGP